METQSLTARSRNLLGACSLKNKDSSGAKTENGSSKRGSWRRSKPVRRLCSVRRGDGNKTAVVSSLLDFLLATTTVGGRRRTYKDARRRKKTQKNLDIWMIFA